MAFLDETGLAELWSLVGDKYGNQANHYVWERYLFGVAPTLGELQSFLISASISASDTTYTLQYSDEITEDGELANPVTISDLSYNNYTAANAVKGKYWTGTYTGDNFSSKLLFTPLDANDATQTLVGSNSYRVSMWGQEVSNVNIAKTDVSYVSSPDANAYPVDDGYTYIALGRVKDGTKISSFNYKGTGTYGSSNPTIWNFDFEPKLIFLNFGANTVFFDFNSVTTGYKVKTVFSGTVSFGFFIKKSANGKTVYIYSMSDSYGNNQFNGADFTYYCTIIG